ncbi:ependymin [Oreochromis niloticus]|uniref:ependymin n=1 Tax=Oreochromis niloticus TaxID=8128 RepID=UPI00025FBF06|nr:ependymin [Oreochromis niloticus]
MNLISLLSCLSVLLAAAVAQYPKPCAVPPLMTGGINVMGANGYMSSTGTISYDAYGQRMRVRNAGIVGNQTFTLDQLMLFSQKVYYEIDWSKLSCKKLPLDASFIPMQVPSDATLVGQAIVGSSSAWGMGILTNTWSGKLSENSFYTSLFTEIGCIPVTFTGYTPQSGQTTINTFNWVLGISNPMDFFPPIICTSSKLEETETPHNVFTALQSLAMKTKRHL